jgi:hypothetical protein
MQIERQWQARFRNSVGGIIFSGARRRGRGKWLSGDEVPQEVRDYLHLELAPGAGRRYYQRDWTSLAKMHTECKPETHFYRGWLVVDFKVQENREPKLRPIHGLVRKLASELGKDTLYGIYRSVYKGTACGPSIGFLIDGLPEDHYERTNAPWLKGTGPCWLYCDSLRTGHGHKWQDPRVTQTIDEMLRCGIRILGISVSSIVEGVDATVEGDKIVWTAGRSPTLVDFWNLVESVDDEAKAIWNDTHGCDDCWNGADCEGEYGGKVVDPDCKSCNGEGVCI